MKPSRYSSWTASQYFVCSKNKSKDVVQAKIDRIFNNRLVRRKILFAV